jgi:hypothetical protein
MMMIIILQAPPFFLLPYSMLSCTKPLILSPFNTLLTANICKMGMDGGLERNIGKCAGGGRVTVCGRRLEHDSVA